MLGLGCVGTWLRGSCGTLTFTLTFLVLEPVSFSTFLADTFGSFESYFVGLLPDPVTFDFGFDITG